MSAWGKSSPLRSCDALLERIEQNDPTLIDLVILPTKTFGEAEVGRLCVVLERNGNTHWKSLTASGHSLPTVSLRRLGKAISGGTNNLSSISVGDRDMGDEGVSPLCEGLAVRDHPLVRIVLYYQGIGSAGFKSISRTLGRMRGVKHLALAQPRHWCYRCSRREAKPRQLSKLRR